MSLPLRFLTSERVSLVPGEVKTIVIDATFAARLRRVILPDALWVREIRVGDARPIARVVGAAGASAWAVRRLRFDTRFAAGMIIQIEVEGASLSPWRGTAVVAVDIPPPEPLLDGAFRLAASIGSCGGVHCPGCSKGGCVHGR